LWRGCGDADKSADFHIASSDGHSASSRDVCSGSNDGPWRAYCDIACGGGGYGYVGAGGGSRLQG
jgi:hypothetical protein